MREKEKPEMISEWEERPVTEMGKTLGKPPMKTTQGACEAQSKYWGFRLTGELKVNLLDLCHNVKGRCVCACDTRTHRYGYMQTGIVLKRRALQFKANLKSFQQSRDKV